MLGNCKIIVGSGSSKDGRKGLALWNNNDDYYVQIFETKEEVNDFIKEIEQKKDELFTNK